MSKLPLDYENYVFDLYGTLVDIHTDEEPRSIWEKLAMFYGYYGAHYSAKELKCRYKKLVDNHEKKLKTDLENSTAYSHEASPEIKIEEVFMQLFTDKGIKADNELAVHAGQFMRVMSTDYVRAYPGTGEMLENLKANGKKVYLLSNAQRIFTEYEMHDIDIFKYFDEIFISSDYGTKKPDIRFFDVLIKKCGIDPKKSLFIGNDSTTDIKGATEAGFDTFYVKSNISPENDMAENSTYKVAEFTKWEY